MKILFCSYENKSTYHYVPRDSSKNWSNNESCDYKVSIGKIDIYMIQWGKNIMSNLLVWWCTHQKHFISRIKTIDLPLCFMLSFKNRSNNEAYDFEQ